MNSRVFQARPWRVLVLVAIIAVPLSAAQRHPVKIDRASIAGTTLTLEGQNFGTGTPDVTVGGETAAVTRSSDTEIVAEIVRPRPGTYPLKVVRDSGEGGTAEAALTIR